MLKQEKSKRGREEEIESEAATTSVPQKSAVAHTKPPGENSLGASGGSALTHTLSPKSPYRRPNKLLEKIEDDCAHTGATPRLAAAAICTSPYTTTPNQQGRVHKTPRLSGEHDAASSSRTRSMSLFKLDQEDDKAPSSSSSSEDSSLDDEDALERMAAAANQRRTSSVKKPPVLARRKPSMLSSSSAPIEAEPGWDSITPKQRRQRTASEEAIRLAAEPVVRTPSKPDPDEGEDDHDDAYYASKDGSHRSIGKHGNNFKVAMARQYRKDARAAQRSGGDD